MPIKQTSTAEKAVQRGVRILLLTILLFAVVLVLIAILFGEKSSSSGYQIQDQDLTAEVIRKSGSTEVFSNGDFPELSAGDRMVLTIAPLESKGKVDDGTLVFSLYHCRVQVYVGGVLVYSQTDPPLAEQIGHRYYMVPLPKGYENAAIRIEAVNEENESVGAPTSIRIVPGTAAVGSFTEGKTPTVILMSTGLTFSLFTSLLAGVRWAADSIRRIRMRRRGKCKDKKEDGKQGHGLFFMALLTNSIILWYSGYAGILTPFVSNTSVLANIEYCALFFIPIPLTGFMEGEAVNRRQKIGCRVLFVLYIAFFTAASFLNFLVPNINYVDFASVLRLVLLVTLAMFALFLARQVKNENTVEIRFAMRGYLVAAVLGTADMIRFDLSSRIGYRYHILRYSLMPATILVLSVTILFYYGMHYSRESFERIERESLRRLAYTDQLTGAPNRSACDRMFQTIHEEKITDYCLVFADVNFLKHTNDTYGHEQGDVLIRSAAEALGKHFGGKDFYGRWGGDEFIAVHFGNLEETNELICGVKEDTERKNEARDFPFEISMSFGVAASTGEHPLTPEEATLAADRVMYENKKQAHADRRD
ncbi:MAG: GGDEF domain-containing protein [Lachnospiraceae bacterium]